MNTVLVWGNRCWVAGDALPAEFADNVNLAASISEKLGEVAKPIRIRLIWQPRMFATAATRCPQGGREVLAAALTEQFPSLDRPECAWSHDPVLPIGEEFSTLLHFEQEPGLFDLVLQLEKHGVIIDSAWPLAAFLHALPTDWSDSGAVTVVAVQEGAALAYHHPANAQRNVHEWVGADAGVQVARWLVDLLSKDPSEPIIVAAASEQILGVMNAHAALHRFENVDTMALTEALGREVVLPSSHPAQLLPRATAVTAERVLMAASIALFLGAATVGGFGFRDRLGQSADEASLARKLAEVRGEVLHLEDNQRQIVGLRRGLDRSAAPKAGKLLRAIIETIPAEITLSELTIGPDGFTLRGHAAPNTGESWDRWPSRLASSIPAAAVQTATKSAAGVRAVSGTFAR